MRSSLCVGLCLVLMVSCLPFAACAGGSGRGSGGWGASRPPASGEEAEVDAVQLSRAREEALALLIEFTTSDEAQLRANAIEALEQVPSRVEPVLPAALVDDNLGVRAIAAMVVGRLRLKDLAPSVRPLLDDDSPFVEASAIYALRRCREDVDLSPLADMLLHHSSPRIRSHAAFILGELGERSAIPLLQEAARTRMPRAEPNEVKLLQLQIAEALVKLGDDESIHAIRAALYPSSPEQLEATALAVQILGEVQDRRARGQLINLAAFRDETGSMMPAEIRLAAAASLAEMGERNGWFIAEEYKDNEMGVVRAQAAHVFGVTGRAGDIYRLEKMMEDPDGLVRVAAASAVIRLTDRLNRGS